METIITILAIVFILAYVYIVIGICFLACGPLFPTFSERLNRAFFWPTIVRDWWTSRF